MRTQSHLRAAVLVAALALVGTSGCNTGVSSDSNNDGNDAGNSGTDSGTNTDSGTGADSGNNTDDSWVQDACVDSAFQANRVPADMMLVLDRSTSMGYKFIKNSNIGPTRISALRDAVSTLLDNNVGTIRFGLTSFPSDDHCGVGDLEGIKDSTAANITAIKNDVNSLSPQGNTPTGATLEKVYDYYTTDLKDATNPKFVLLVTDGAPNCKTYNHPDADKYALDEVKQLMGKGIKTFVIGIGQTGDFNPDLLNQMAVAGGEERSGTTKYYPADSVDALNSVLATIGGLAAGCSFKITQLPADPTTIDPNKILVTVDGAKIDRTGNWEYDAANYTVKFTQSYCDAHKDMTNVAIKMGCTDNVIIPN